MAHPGGRPTKYKPEYAEQARKLCLLGYTDKELADFYEVEESTINNWKHSHPKFLESIKAGKEVADGHVVQSLYSNATGFTKTVQKPMAESIGNNQGSEIRVIEYEEFFPPQTTAQIFWLKNRQPAKFRDKQEVEQTGTLTVNFHPLADEANQ